MAALALAPAAGAAAPHNRRDAPPGERKRITSPIASPYLGARERYHKLLDAGFTGSPIVMPITIRKDSGTLSNRYPAGRSAGASHVLTPREHGPSHAREHGPSHTRAHGPFMAGAHGQGGEAGGRGGAAGLCGGAAGGHGGAGCPFPGPSEASAGEPPGPGQGSAGIAAVASASAGPASSHGGTERPAAHGGTERSAAHGGTERSAAHGGTAEWVSGGSSQGGTERPAA
jgi:hypothetical protein